VIYIMERLNHIAAVQPKNQRESAYVV
jgi:hypothetical protein